MKERDQYCVKTALLTTFLLALVSLVISVLAFNDTKNLKSTFDRNKLEANGSNSYGTTSTSATNTSSITIDEILRRGFLRCGVPSEQPGFAITSLTENQTGFDADMCRAVAAAVFGKSAGHIEFIPIISGSERWTALRDRKIDVLSLVTTNTMERDVYESESHVGFEFSSPYLYNGLGFGGIPPFGACADKLETSGNCSKLLLCVNQGTTHMEVVRNLFPPQNVIPVPSANDLYVNLISGACNAITEEQFGIAESVVKLTGYTGSYEIGVNQFSKEPLAVVTLEGDAFWSDLVFWVVEALMAADEQNILQSNASSFALAEEFGEKYSHMFQDAISDVGNYGEMYARHLESIVPRNSLNKVNHGQSGLIYSFPYGTLGVVGSSPHENGTIDEIKRRGHLRCGIFKIASFGDFNRTTKEWRGMDVDHCRALSAAIFDGADKHIVYHVLPETEQFKALATGDVDCLCRVTSRTLQQNVKESTTGVGFSFSPAIFYDGLSFGGIPPFGACANRLDVSSQNCTELRICVNDGTDTIARVRELFPESNIVPTSPGLNTVDAFISKKCNALGGSSHDISEANVRRSKFSGDYEVGNHRHSKEQFAIVMRKNDPQFTNFVRWIVYSTFYAEENDIGISNADKMPQTNLFGPLYRDMFFNVINAVGNHGEMYSRSVEILSPRNGSLNALNSVPFGPQQYPLF